MTAALPNPFEFDRQAKIDLLALAAVADALDLVDEEPIEPMPVFLRDPSPAYLSATQLRPICEIIATHAAHANR